MFAGARVFRRQRTTHRREWDGGHEPAPSPPPPSRPRAKQIVPRQGGQPVRAAKGVSQRPAEGDEQEVAGGEEVQGRPLGDAARRARISRRGPELHAAPDQQQGGERRGVGAAAEFQRPNDAPSATNGGTATAAAPTRAALRDDLEDVAKRPPDALQSLARARGGPSAARRAERADAARLRPLLGAGPSAAPSSSLGRHRELQYRPVHQLVCDRRYCSAASAATNGDAPDDDGVANPSSSGSPAPEEKPKHATFDERRGCTLIE